MEVTKQLFKFYFTQCYLGKQSNRDWRDENRWKRETQTLICSLFLHHSCKWQHVPKIKFRIIQTYIPLFIISTFQGPPPTLVSRLMKNFAASWKTEPGWGPQNTPLLKCKISIHTLELLSADSWASIVAHIGYCFFFFNPSPELSVPQMIRSSVCLNVQ